MKECVVVLGMHRSGTSVISGLVSLQGYYLGKEALPPGEDNPKGFFENIKIYRLNNTILRDYGTSWDDYSFTIQDVKLNDLDRYKAAIKEVIKEEFGSKDRIFIKDPRMCLLFPLWEKVLKEMGYKIKVILVWRSPMEVAHSLAARNEMAVEKSLMIWSHHFFQAEKNSRNYKRFLLHYADDFRDLNTFLKKLGEFLGIEPTEEMFQDAHELYTAKLKHHLVELKSITNELPLYLKELITVLLRNDIGNKVKLDELNDEFTYSKKYYLYDQAQQEEKLETKAKKITHQQEQLDRLEQLYDEQTKELEQNVRELAIITKLSNEGDKKINQLEGLLSDEKLRHDQHKQKLEAIKLESEATKQELEATIQEFELVESRFTKAEHIFQSLFRGKVKYSKSLKSLRGESSLKNKLYLLFVNKKKRLLLKDMELIGQSGLFSPLHYLSSYPDVWETGLDPLMHFCEYGWKEGRQPSENFDIDAYVNDNPRISRENINPLVHFIEANKRFSGSTVKDISNRIIPALTRYFKKAKAYAYSEPVLTPEIKKEVTEFKESPLMSIIIPVYNVEKKWLKKAILSVENQWYANWEINIADDASSNLETINYLKSLENPKINIKYLNENGNISKASNEALSMANGDYVVLMDHDDELTPDALYEIVRSINVDGAEFIYSDEDKLEMDGSFCDPNFKPDYAPDTFLSTNYLSHLGAIKKSLIDKVGGFSIGLEGAQDYDLYLKVLEYTTKISHIQKVLYHWRKIPGSTAASFSDKSYANEAGRLALQRAIERRKIRASVDYGNSPGLYRIKYELVDHPLVSIIIPFNDKPDLLKLCIGSIVEKTTYKNFEIIGISNNSKDKATYDEMDRLKRLDSRIQFYEYNVPFNYSKINNNAVEKYAKGEQLIFLNNDIEIITPEWIEELLMYSQQENIGAVGCKLYYPDNTVQHAGLVIAPYTSHSVINVFRKSDRKSSGYGARLAIANNYLAVTAACMMLAREKFNKVGGFDDDNLKIAYNDVDLCLSLVELGYRNIYTPYCEAYHYESASRGAEDSLEKIERSRREAHLFKEKHKSVFRRVDPYYNRNLDDHSECFAVSKENTTERKAYYPKVFSHKILKNKIIRNQNNKYICIFSHFDKDGIVDDYVVSYLKSLNVFTDIVFVSTAETMPVTEINKIEPFCNQIIIKENFGYDFGAWKTGLELTQVKISDYEYLILCNDSVYGPLYDLKKILDEAMSKYDVFSITDSYEIAHHLQSYFIVYSRTAFSHKLFKEFWDGFVIYENKSKLIKENEVKFSESLIDSNLSVSTYCKAEDMGHLNQLHFYWDRLIVDQNCPFIKIELLRDNPRNIPIKNWRNIIKQTGYDLKLIEGHLNKMRSVSRYLLF